MDTAQALGVAVAAFVAFLDPQGCALTRAATQAPEQVEMIGRRVLNTALAELSKRLDARDARIETAGAAVPDAIIHARATPL